MLALNIMSQSQKVLPKLTQLFGIDLTQLTKSNRKELLDKITPKSILGALVENDIVVEVNVKSPSIFTESKEPFLKPVVYASTGELFHLRYQRRKVRGDIISIRPEDFEPLQNSSFYAHDFASSPFDQLRRKIYEWGEPNIYHQYGELISFDKLPEEVKKSFEDDRYVFRKPLQLTQEDVLPVMQTVKKYCEVV